MQQVLHTVSDSTDVLRFYLRSRVAPFMARKFQIGPTLARSSVEEKLAAGSAKLHPRRRELIRLILEDAAETCFLSSPELARRHGVDTATLVRTVQAVGYAKYADFTAALREHLFSRLTPYTRLKGEAEEQRSCSDQVRHSLAQDIEGVSGLTAKLDVDLVVAVAEQIQAARRIMIVGVDSAASLSWYFAYGLRVLGLSAEAATGTPGYLDWTTLQLTPEDLVIAISFGRCTRITVETVLRAKREKIPTFGVTDSPSTAIARFCDHHISAPVTLSAHSLAAPMVAINAVLMACAHVRRDRTLATLQRVEDDYASGARWYDPPMRQAVGDGGRSRQRQPKRRLP